MTRVLLMARVRCCFCGRLVHWRVVRRHETACLKVMNLITWFLNCDKDS